MASQHGLCELCGEVNDTTTSSLVLVECNHQAKGCADRVYHQDCIIDLVDRRSTSRRTFYLKKQSHFDLSGFPCPNSRFDEPGDPRRCTGKIAMSTQLHQVKKLKKTPAVAVPLVRDVTCGSRKAPRTGRLPSSHVAVGARTVRQVPFSVASSASAAAAAAEASSPTSPKHRVPVGWEPADEEAPSPRVHSSPRAVGAAAATPWWAAPAPAPHVHAPTRPSSSDSTSVRAEPPSRANTPLEDEPASEPETIQARIIKPPLAFVRRAHAPTPQAPPAPAPPALSGLSPSVAAFMDAMTLTGALQCGALDEKVLLQLSAVAETTALHALRMLAQRLMPSSSEVALSSPLGAADVGPWLLGAIEAAGNPMQTLPAGPLLAAPPMPSIMAPAMPPPMAPMAPMAPTAAPQSCEQSPGASATAALAADSGVRALFCAALREVSRRRLLPLSNASKLSDVMGSLDGGWAEARKSYAPFSRLLWSFERDVQEAGLALQPCEGGAGFALVEARAEAYQSPSNGGGSGGGGGGGDVRGDDARLELAYEARLMGALRDGGWKLLSLLGERERGSPVPPQLRCSLKAFIAARPALFQLAWDAPSGAWRTRLSTPKEGTGSQQHTQCDGSPCQLASKALYDHPPASPPPTTMVPVRGGVMANPWGAAAAAAAAGCYGPAAAAAGRPAPPGYFGARGPGASSYDQAPSYDQPVAAARPSCYSLFPVGGPSCPQAGPPGFLRRSGDDARGLFADQRRLYQPSFDGVGEPPSPTPALNLNQPSSPGYGPPAYPSQQHAPPWAQPLTACFESAPPPPPLPPPPMVPFEEGTAHGGVARAQPRRLYEPFPSPGEQTNAQQWSAAPMPPPMAEGVGMQPQRRPPTLHIGCPTDQGTMTITRLGFGKAFGAQALSNESPTGVLSAAASPDGARMAGGASAAAPSPRTVKQLPAPRFAPGGGGQQRCGGEAGGARWPTSLAENEELEERMCGIALGFE